MLEKQAFRDAGRIGKLARGGAVESLLGKDTPHGLDDRGATIFASVSALSDPPASEPDSDDAPAASSDR